MMRTVSDRDYVVAFVALCAAVLGGALVLGLAVRVFFWVSGL